jgi:hypothetical protein
MQPSDATVIRWLHLTDLHFGHNNQAQQVALNSLLGAVTRYGYGKPFDLVLLTGDLAYSGKRHEYEALTAGFMIGLKRHELCRNAPIVAVPGNHDLDCDIEYPPVWKELGPTRQERFFHFGPEGKRTRGSRANAFAEYQRFVAGHGIRSVDPTLEPLQLIDLQLSGHKLLVVSAVTAFFADKETSDHQKAPAPVPAIRSVIQGVPTDNPILVLGHHPPEWFTLDSSQHLHSLLVECNAIYLHGHEHKVRSKFGARGLTCLGFGAAYQSSISGVPTPYYRNSFAICELADSLHVSIVSWDAEYGQWRPEQHLQGDFVDRSDRLTDGYVLSLPTTKLLDRTRPYTSVGAAIRREIHIDRCIWLADAHPKRWTDLLCTIGVLRGATDVYLTPTQVLPQGHLQFRLKDHQDQYLVHAVAGHGDILSFEQLQSINTELDRQSFDGCIVATMGELSSEAKTLSRQLAAKKAINVLEREDIVRRSIKNLSPGLERTLMSAAAAHQVNGSLIVTDDGFALLLKERLTGQWFQLVDENGYLLPESSALVTRLRHEMPALRNLRYADLDHTQAITLPQPDEVAIVFDREEYLHKCHVYFDEVKYAPLAALGFRFRRASLSEIYVEAKADVGGSTKASQSLTRAVSEFLASLNLPETQQQQLETQLRSQYGLNRSAEVGAARKLCQRYNNVVVLGDPGSGKTCFVKYELLAYCAPESERAAWYSRHLPIYVPLAEAAKLLGEGLDLLQICEVVSSRRGIQLPRAAIVDALTDGQGAFFFDGLDEVGLVDRRVALLTEIDKLVKAFAARGNRFILTSRPAAVQPVDIPEGLTYLHLKGLTDSEIRILAGRVLTTRLGESDSPETSRDEVELIEKLLDDTRSQPGIARIARNPLLLTLLVLIYAGSGALSARRHVIYSQAIKTLVSVRGRDTREQQISEADLRIRLGALALAIFDRNIAEIPTRTEVASVLTPYLRVPEPRNDESARHISDAFIQEVAEATGLLSIHAREVDSAEDLVTFMHYSFLEYYAAAGLISQDYLRRVPPLTGHPRWRDVITLLFGMLSEQTDVTPLLTAILGHDENVEEITRYRTLLAMDCAAECDVPPEQSQLLMANAVYTTIAGGAGRYSAELRGEVAKRLDNLLSGAGSPVRSKINEGLRDSDPLIAASFCDLLARVSEDVRFDSDLLFSFEAYLDNDHPVARAAAMYALERHLDLRSAKALSITMQSLTASVIEKHAALRVVAAEPSLAGNMRSELRELLDDSNALIAGTAAQCLLVDTLSQRRRDEGREFVDKLLRTLQRQPRETAGVQLKGVEADRDSIRSFALSENEQDSELAIRCIPLVKTDGQFAHDLLIQKLTSTESSRLKAASLQSLSACSDAIPLVTIADTDLICKLLQHDERNVRIAAVMVLGQLPDDEQVVQSLEEHFGTLAKGASRGEELAEVGRALAMHVRRNGWRRDVTLRALLERIEVGKKRGFGDADEQHTVLELLSLCESIGGVVDEAEAKKVLKLADDYRTPLSIRRQAIRVYGRIVEPTRRSVDTVLRWMRRDDRRFNEAHYAAVASLVWQCRRKVEYVRRVYAQLAELRDTLISAWRRELARAPESIDPSGIRDLREAISTVANLMMSYEEFAGRATLN